MMSKGFVTGAVVGVLGVWVFHHFVSPIPGGKKG